MVYHLWSNKIIEPYNVKNSCSIFCFLENNILEIKSDKYIGCLRYYINKKGSDRIGFLLNLRIRPDEHSDGSYIYIYNRKQFNQFIKLIKIHAFRGKEIGYDEEEIEKFFKRVVG